MAIHQNGNAPQPRSAGSMRSTAQKEAGITDKQAHERLMFLFGAAVVRFIQSKSGMLVPQY